MSVNHCASAAHAPPPASAVIVAHALQRQAQDEAAESHCYAMQAPKAAIALVDDNRQAVCESTFEPRLSPQLCCAVFRSRSAVLVCALMAAQLQLPRAQFHDMLAMRCNSMCVYTSGVVGEERVRAIGGGGVGLLVLRMTAAGGACGRDVKRLMMSVMRRTAAVHAAATPEAFCERGQRECNEGLYANAAASWGRAVDLNHPHAHALLSTMLVEGRPQVPVDCPRAFALASAGADMGCMHSKGVLGRCLGAGFGVAADPAKAVSLGRESAAAGSCMGQFVVGKCYHAGWGVAQDYAEAVRFYRLAAAQAQCNLGVMLELGRGVPQNYTEAVRFFDLAAAQGNMVAQCNMGNMFERGLGIAQDDAAAVRCYRIAAAQGYANAQYNVGVMFELGQGVVQDRAEAIRWIRLAAAQGDADATAALEALGG